MLMTPDRAYDDCFAVSRHARRARHRPFVTSAYYEYIRSIGATMIAEATRRESDRKSPLYIRAHLRADAIMGRCID